MPSFQCFLGRQPSGAGPARIPDSGGDRGTDWNEIGLRNALGDGMYPLILTSGLLLGWVAYFSYFDGPIIAPLAQGLLLPVLAMWAAG